MAEPVGARGARPARRGDLADRVHLPDGVRVLGRGEVGHRPLVARPLPHHPGERLNVLLGRLAAGDARSDHRPRRDHRAERPDEVR